MHIINFADHNSIINQYMSELRDVNIQQDRMRFRRNLERIGEIMAYEISRTLNYTQQDVSTPLGIKSINKPSDSVVLATILRAGLTENQLSAAVVTIGVIAAMVLLNMLNLLTDSDGQPLISSFTVRSVIDWVSVLSRFSAFLNGVFDYAAILYYASLSFIFVFLTVRVYEKRRWG